MKPSFYLTRHAATDLRRIYRYSSDKWGETAADRYMGCLYEAFAKIARQPQLGDTRKHRTAPFLLYPAGKHFIVYDRLPKGVVIVTVLHQVQNIERILSEMSAAFLEQVTALRFRLLS